MLRTTLLRPHALRAASARATPAVGASASQQSRSMAKFAPYNWEDPLDMGSLLTDEQQAIHDTARTYAQDKLVPRILNGWRTEKLDLNILKEMGELGLLGPTIKGYGCAGTDYVSYGLIMREVER